MKRIRSFSQRYAILFAVLVTVLFQLIFNAFGLLQEILPETTFGSAANELINIIWPIGLAVILGYGFIFKEKGFFSTLKAGISFFAVYAIMIVINIITCSLDPSAEFRSAEAILFGILTMAGIGIREEVIFRGIVTNALALKYAENTKRLWAAVLIPGFLFGAAHIMNVFAGIPLKSVLIQSAAAAGMAIFLAAVYLRGGNIWFMALLHALIDAFGYFDSTFAAGSVSSAEITAGFSLFTALGLPVIEVVIALILLRKKKRPEIYERFAALRLKLSL